jgi:hypothetical protein
MRVKVGTKTTEPMVTGLRWPAIAIEDETEHLVTVINRSTGQPVDITVTRADFISLRETREGEQYLALTNEVVQYGYRPVAMPRLTTIVGLDATEDGEVIPLQSLIEKHALSFSEWQAKNYEARKGVTAAADI